MTFLRNIGQDLVDKRLWPVVVILVALLVAVPVVLGGGSDAEPVADTATPVPVAGLPAVAGEISVAADAPSAVDRPRSRRDPFKQQFVRKATEVTAADAAGATPGATPPIDVGSETPAGSGGSTPSPTPDPSPPSVPSPRAKSTPAPAPKLDDLDVYRVAMRFGTPARKRTLRDVSRLSPLPNADTPFFVFLGVLKGGKKAVFLVSSDATPTGDGRCLPSRSDCQTVELEVGDTQFFDVARNGRSTQYELDLLSIRRRTGPATSTLPTPAPTKASKDSGDDAASALAAGTGYRWDGDAGVLVRRSSSASARTRAEQSEAQAAAAQADREAQTAALVAWYLAIIGSIEYAVDRAAEAATAPTPAPVPGPVPAPAALP